MNQLKEAGKGTVSSDREEGYKGRAETVQSGMDDRPKELGKSKGPVGGETGRVVKERLTTEVDEWCGKGQTERW